LEIRWCSVSIFFLLEPKLSHMGGNYKWSIRIFYLVHFVLATDFFIVNPTLYLFVEEFGGDRAFQGYIIGAFFGAMTLMIPVMGQLCIYFPYKLVLAGSTVVCIMGNLLYVFSPNKWCLLAGRTLAGVAAAVDGVVYIYFSQVIPKHELTPHLAILRASFSCGQIIAPAISLVISYCNVHQELGWMNTQSLV